MNFARIKLPSLILVSFLPALLVLAISVNTAQAANVSLLCLGKDSSGQFTQTTSAEWPTGGKCSTKTTPVTPSSVPSDFKAICALVETDTNKFAIYNGVNAAGKLSCDNYSGDPRYTSVNLISRSSIKGTDPNPPSSQNSQTSGTSPVKNTTVKNTTGSSSTKSTSKVNGGDCPEGFDSKGPLCVPKNPFDGDGIGGDGTIGELASTIISILLGLSGIVAVIMIIIGGYLYMTARGNETQQSNGRKTLTNALIGLAIIIVSFAVVQAVTNYLTKSQS